MSPAPVPPRMPVAVRCTCGHKIVLEPRFVGKPTGCGECGRNFIVRMLLDPQTRRWSPHLTYTDANPKKGAAPEAPTGWCTVICRCGHKIGLDSRFVGKPMTCKACQREFTVRMVQSSEGGDTAIIRYISEPAGAKKEEAPKAAPSKNPTRRGKTVAPPEADDPSKLGSPPNEMHLLCTCGEELTVDRKFYNDKLCCAGCGTVMQLRLIFVPNRSKYELEARVVNPSSS